MEAVRRAVCDIHANVIHLITYIVEEEEATSFLVTQVFVQSIVYFIIYYGIVAGRKIFVFVLEVQLDLVYPRSMRPKFSTPNNTRIVEV